MYDHNRKAGNQGDVIKHPALIAAADALLDERKGVFYYADTFAGYAYNPLRPDGEWQQGIGVLAQSTRTSKSSAVNFWWDLWSCKAGLLGSVYPGSSTFILKLCLSRGRPLRSRLWDVSPAVVAQLMTAYDTETTAIYPRAATAEDLSGEKSDLLLVDPPGLRSQSKQEYPDLTDLFRLLDVAENVIIWLPITAQEDGSVTKAKCLGRRLEVTSVCWPSQGDMCGCMLAYRLPPTAASELQAAVGDVSVLMNWDRDCVTHEA